MHIDSVGFTSLEPPVFCNPAQPNEGYKRLARDFEGMGQGGLLIALGQLSCLEGVQNPESEFTLVPQFGVGRTASRQGVYFGTLDLSSERHQPITSHVAVKPYDRRRVDLGARPAVAIAHDIATSAHLRRISDSSAYVPLGVYRSFGTFFVPNLLTNFEERSTSLDGVFRQTEEGSIGRKVLHAMKLGHFGLGVLHGAKIIHGDAFPQNFATDGTRVVMNDTTTFRPFGNNGSAVMSKTREDIQDFMQGVFHPDASTDFTRSVSAPVIRNPSVRLTLWRAYAEGVGLSLNRLREASAPLGVLGEDEHACILRTVVDKYAA